MQQSCREAGVEAAETVLKSPAAAVKGDASKEAKIQLATTMNRRKEKWGGSEKGGEGGGGESDGGPQQENENKSSSSCRDKSSKEQEHTHTPPQIYTCCRLGRFWAMRNP
ncbi:unnamed protein product [Sphagnum compactum]